MRSSWRTDWKNAPGHIGGAEYGKKKKQMPFRRRKIRKNTENARRQKKHKKTEKGKETISKKNRFFSGVRVFAA